jgi:hypothetical protein
MSPATATIGIEQLITHLNQIRERHGEEAFQQARRGFAVTLILKPNGDKFVSKAFPDLDLDDLRKEAEAQQTAAIGQTSPEELLMGMLRQQVPNIKTQAHYNTFMACFDALRTCLNNYFGHNPEAAGKAREALYKALDMAAKLPEIEDQLAEIPDNLKSKEAKAFTSEPREFHEYDKQRTLMAQLSGISDLDTLERWYAENRQTMDEITDKRLRNELFDSVREKRALVR